MKSQGNSGKILVMISLALWLVYLGQMEPTKNVTGYILPFKFENPEVAKYILWVIWAYNLWRHWQSQRGEWSKFQREITKHVSQKQYLVNLVTKKAEAQQPNIAPNSGKRIVKSIKIKRNGLRVIEHTGSGDSLEKTLRFTLSPIHWSWFRLVFSDYKFLVGTFIKDEKLSAIWLPFISATLTVFIFFYAKIWL